MGKQVKHKLANQYAHLNLIILFVFRILGSTSGSTGLQGPPGSLPVVGSLIGGQGQGAANYGYDKT